MTLGSPGFPNHISEADHQQRAEAGDPRLAAAAGIRNRAQHRRQQRDHQAGGRGGKSPQRLPLRRIRRDEAGEIGRKHKGGDQREIRLRGPIEENPADDGGAARIFPRISAPDASEAITAILEMSCQITITRRRFACCSETHIAFGAATAVPCLPGTDWL
jgi:hypothetical protein